MINKFRTFILLCVLVVALLFTCKILNKEESNHNVGSDIATQVYYTDQVFAGWGWGLIINWGYRLKVTLTEYSTHTPISLEKEDVTLWWTVQNNTSATVTRTEEITISLQGKVSSTIGASVELIKAEIGAEISSTYTHKLSLQVVCPANTSIDVYTYKALKKVGYLKEDAQPQLRISFWYVNVGSSNTSYGSARAYKGAGTYLVYS